MGCRDNLDPSPLAFPSSVAGYCGGRGRGELHFGSPTQLSWSIN